jgi:hypothetical protein
MEDYIPMIIVALVYAGVNILNMYFRHKAINNPEKDIWDHVYNVSKTAVSFVEQNFRPSLGNKLNSDEAKQLFKMALDKTKMMLSNDVKAFLKGDMTESHIDDVIGAMIERHVNSNVNSKKK